MCSPVAHTFVCYHSDIPSAPDSYWNLFKARWRKYGWKAIGCCCTGKDTTGGTWENDENTPYHHGKTLYTYHTAPMECCVCVCVTMMM